MTGPPHSIDPPIASPACRPGGDRDGGGGDAGRAHPIWCYRRVTRGAACNTRAEEFRAQKVPGAALDDQPVVELIRDTCPVVLLAPSSALGRRRAAAEHGCNPDQREEPDASDESLAEQGDRSPGHPFRNTANMRNDLNEL